MQVRLPYTEVTVSETVTLPVGFTGMAVAIGGSIFEGNVLEEDSENTM